MIPLVDVKAQYARLIPELKRVFAEVLEDGRFVFGPNVKAFEAEAAATSACRRRSASGTAPTRS